MGLNGKFKGIGLLIILHILNVNEASTPAVLSQQPNNDYASDNGRSQLPQSQSQISSSPYLYNDNHGPRVQEALASRRQPPKINTYVPNPSIQSKRLGGPINTNGFSPSGRVDSIPGLDINVNNPGNQYNNAPPPVPPPRSTFKTSSRSPKLAPAVSAPRIRKPFVSKGYIDASDQPRDLSGKIDGQRNPNKLLPPSIEGTKIDRVSERLSPSPRQPPPRPQNPYAHEQQPFRSGREYINAQRNNPNAQRKAPFNDAQSNGPFNDAQRNPSFNNDEQRNDPFGNAQRTNPFSNAQNNDPLNNRNPTSNNNAQNNNRLRNPVFPSAPKSRDTPDYSQRYNEPQRPSYPQQSNSSFSNPRNGDFVPFDSNNKPQSSRNDPHSIPSLPAPFEFSNILKRDQEFPFPSSASFNSRPQRPRPTRTYGPSDLFQEFPNPMDTYSPAPQSKAPINGIPQQRIPVASVAPSYRDNRAITSNPRYQDPRRDLVSQGVAPAFASDAGGIYGNRGQQQCFQYSFPAEAYRLSDIAKDYPKDQIQKEIDANPYISPLVGQEAKATANDPFTFNAPISSHFDFSSFGFKNDATTSDKYEHLKNVKAYPGNLQKGDIVGRYPSSMQPLDSACPTKEYRLKSFFHEGGDCYVINPDFQDVTYHRCTRQDCNFCGVNRGLSACVEEYRWVSLVAYCSALQENKRIAPMRLLLPVGCSCQHFVC